MAFMAGIAQQLGRRRAVPCDHPRLELVPPHLVTQHAGEAQEEKERDERG